MALDRREILSKGASLQKAISNKEPTSNIISILNDLKVGVKPTEDLLRATGIGKIVNKVKGQQGLDPSIQQLASEIISRWRHTVNEQKSLSSGISTPTNGASPSTARVNGATSPNPKPSSPAPPLKATSPPTTAGIDPSKRSWKADKVPVNEITSDKSRNNCIGLLYDGLALNTDTPAPVILTLVKRIESHAHTTLTPPDYREKMRSLFQNLKNKSNPTLRKNILSGAISPERFVTMSLEEMKSDAQKLEEQKMLKENMDKAMVAQEEKSVSTSLECGKCHKKMVSYSQAQTRSADEPMTTFCECLNCGNRWKFS